MCLYLKKINQQIGTYRRCAISTYNNELVLNIVYWENEYQRYIYVVVPN